MIRQKLSLIIIVLFVIVCPCLVGQDKQPKTFNHESMDLPPDIYVTRLSERILQLKVRGPLGTNIVVVATKKGLVVIDTYTAPFIFEQVTEIVKKEFGRDDFAYVINSHPDVDHAGGNGFFEDIIIVGHEELFKELNKRHAGRKRWQARYRGRIQGWTKGREEKLTDLDDKTTKEAKELMVDIKFLKKVDKDFENGFPIMPANPKVVISFEDSKTLNLGDITIECYACKAGHSPADILVYIPEEEFLFTGDAAQPYIQKDVNMKQWLAQLYNFTQPDKPVKFVLDGHGVKPYTKQDLRQLHDYFKQIWVSIQKAHQKGLSLEQIKTKCALENISSIKSLLNTPFADTMENFKGTHEHNIEFLVNRLNQQ